jgi:hypothetical protein
MENPLKITLESYHLPIKAHDLIIRKFVARRAAKIIKKFLPTKGNIQQSVIANIKKLVIDVDFLPYLNWYKTSSYYTPSNNSSLFANEIMKHL